MFFKHVQSVILHQHELSTLQRHLQDYLNILRNFGLHSNIVKSSTLKTMIQDEFHDTLGFHTSCQKNQSTLIFDTSAKGRYAEMAISCWDILDEQLVKTAAKGIKGKIFTLPNMPWPPLVDDLVEVQESDELLSKFNTTLRNPGIDWDSTVTALTLLLTSHMTRQRALFQVKLSVMLHELTRSSKLLTCLRSFSLGISYEDLLILHDTWAKYDTEQNKSCPKEFAVGMPGTEVMDNDDVKDDTLIGKNTSHRTNVLLVNQKIL